MSNETNAGTSTGYAEQLKRVYADGAKNQINQKAATYKALKDATGAEVDLVGSGLYFNARLGRGAQAAFIGEDASFAPARKDRSKQASATAKEIYAKINFTRLAKNLSKTNQAAFAKIFAEKMDEAAMSLTEQIGRAIIGNKESGSAVTGIIGTVASWSSPTVTMATGFAGQLRPGMYIAFGATPGTIQHYAEVLKVTGTTTFTVENLTGTPVAGNTIWIGRSASGQEFTSYAQEWTGLAHIVASSGALHGLDPATSGQTSWAAYVDQPVTSRVWSNEIMNDLVHGIDAQSGDKPHVLLMHYKTRTAMVDVLQKDVRYAPQEFRGGFKENMHVWNNGERDMPVIVDNFITPGLIYAVNTDHLKIGNAIPLGWVDDETGDTVQRESGKATYEGAYGMAGNLVCFKRNAHGLLGSLTVDLTNVAFAA